MRFLSGLTVLLSLASGVIVAVPPIAQEAAVDGRIPRTIEDFQDLAIKSLQDAEASRQGRSGGCTLANARVRRDWESLSKEDRKGYIKAVQCLWDLPRVDPVFSAAQNYFDEFVAIHVNLTDFIHGTGNFLTWHRYILHVWEEKLRNDCGYKGALPYWNWFKYQDNLEASPLFDGSDTSLGGDGEFVAHNGSIAGAGKVLLPSGKGGGCIKSGPFVGRTINIGPIRPAMDGYLPVMKNQLGYNPRCQRRDLTNAAAARFTPQALYDLLLGDHSHSIGHFQDELQGPYGTLRMHGAGHYAMGGDGSDVFSSLNDPAFYQHHAMLDRVYWMWQILHPQIADTINGTRTFRDTPPSASATVEDLLNIGVLGEHLPIKNMFDTLGNNPLCYVYA